MKAGSSQTDSAREIGVHKSKVCREMRRNRGKRAYRRKQAHAMAAHRRTKAPRFVKLTPPVIAVIEKLITSLQPRIA